MSRILLSLAAADTFNSSQGRLLVVAAEIKPRLLLRFDGVDAFLLAFGFYAIALFVFTAKCVNAVHKSL